MRLSGKTRAQFWRCVLAFTIAAAAAGRCSAQDPIRVAYECTEADADAFGLTCTMDDPCPVFLELAGAGMAGNRIVATGNLHMKTITLYGVVLASDDDGVTWTEPQPRIRSAALEQVQFINAQNGWIAGVAVDPLARNPFLLATADGGRTWQQKPVLEDTKYATIGQLHFDSASHGELVLDVPQPKGIRQELYESQTGGESWELKQVNNAPIQLKSAHGAAQNPLRIRTDATSGTYVLERGSGAAWRRVASFAVRVADCQ
jgi:photosystem II stability/assembly factor-like uncharacterized protein